MKYARITRLIHIFLATFIILQLVIGELMDVPGVGESQQASNVMTSALTHKNMADAAVGNNLLFNVHEYLGLFIICLVMLRLVWGIIWRGNANWRTVFLWLTAEGRKELAHDFRRSPEIWMTGKLPEPSDQDSLAKAVHGFLILAATGMVLSGLVLYFGWNEQGHQSWLISGMGDVHAGISGLLWTLLGGHIFMALWHQMLGHNLIGKMFSLKS